MLPYGYKVAAVPPGITVMFLAGSGKRGRVFPQEALSFYLGKKVLFSWLLNTLYTRAVTCAHPYTNQKPRGMRSPVLTHPLGLVLLLRWKGLHLSYKQIGVPLPKKRRGGWREWRITRDSECLSEGPLCCFLPFANLEELCLVCLASSAGRLHPVLGTIMASSRPSLALWNPVQLCGLNNPSHQSSPSFTLYSPSHSTSPEGTMHQDLHPKVCPVVWHVSSWSLWHQCSGLNLPLLPFHVQRSHWESGCGGGEWWWGCAEGVSRVFTVVDQVRGLKNLRISPPSSKTMEPKHLKWPQP